MPWTLDNEREVINSPPIRSAVAPVGLSVVWILERVADVLASLSLVKTM